MYYSKVFSATFDSMEKIIPWITQHIPEVYVENIGRHKVELALEELFVNIIEHGYKRLAHPIFIIIKPANDHFQCEIRDFAPPFNPLKHVSFDSIKDLESQPIGGQGIKLIKAVFENLDYCFMNEMNVLRLKLG